MYPNILFNLLTLSGTYLHSNSTQLRLGPDHLLEQLAPGRELTRRHQNNLMQIRPQSGREGNVGFLLVKKYGERHY